MSTGRPTLGPYLLVAVLLQMVWGVVPSASKWVIEEIPVELYIAIRWSLSGIIFAIYLLVVQGWVRISIKDFASVSLLGVLGYGVASLGSLYGLKIGGVTNFALLSALGPVVISGVSVFVLRERPNRMFYLALPFSVFGLIFLVMGKYQISSLTVAGASAAFIVGAQILEAIVFAYSKKFRARMHPAQYLGTAQISTALLMWGLQGLVFQQTPDLAQLTLKGASAALFVSVVACVLCYAVLYWLLIYVEGHRLALFDSLHTLSAVTFGYFLFDERLTPLMVVGGLLIVAGLLSGNLPMKRKDLRRVYE